MKRLIMCEGKHDSLFIGKICSNLNMPEPKIFDQLNAKETSSQDAETVEFRRFFQRSSPYNLLVKSECGKDNAIKIYSRSMDFFIRTKELKKAILMLDLDGSALDTKLKKISNTIKGKNVAEPIHIKSNTIKDTNLFYFLENTIQIMEDNHELGKFYLVFFKRSLEKELEEIENREDVTIENKILQFVEIEEVQNIFSLILN